jgi:hypothetical protein
MSPLRRAHLPSLAGCLAALAASGCQLRDPAPATPPPAPVAPASATPASAGPASDAGTSDAGPANIAASATPGATPSAAGAGESADHHLSDLDARIAQLERTLAGEGSGALAGGSTFRVDNEGQETLLERQRRLQRQVETDQAAIAQRDRTIADLRRDLANAGSRGDQLAERADALSHAQDHLLTAQQELAERQMRLDALHRRIEISELQRLHAEKAYYLLAGALLKLAPGQTQEFLDLQDQVRQQITQTLAHGDGEPQPEGGSAGTAGTAADPGDPRPEGAR